MWMSKRSMAYPIWLRIRFFEQYGDRRLGTSWKMIEHWRSMNPDFEPEYTPAPWYVGEHALGPFYPFWKRLRAIVRKGRGGRSHRCEFTDKERGALYGGKEGGFMDAYFEQFIRNISGDLEVQEYLEEKYDQFQN
jgi:hypothetical protein